MLPRLEAEERLGAITDGMVASGVAGRDLARETFARLQRAAGVARAKPRKANAAVLGAMGVGVRGPLAASRKPPGEPSSDPIGAANG